MKKEELTPLSVLMLFYELSSHSVRAEKVKVTSLTGHEVYQFRCDKLEEYAACIAAWTLSLKMSGPDAESSYWIQARYKSDGTAWTLDSSDVDRLLAMGRALGFILLHESSATSCVDVPKISVDYDRCKKFADGQTL